MDQPVVRIEGLSHRYSIQWAIRDIDIEIRDKGIYGLLGSNGAGKSTLMNIMCGVLKQTRGDVYINGLNTREEPVKAKEFIGFLPQKPPLHNDLTVWEYLRYTAILLEQQERLCEVRARAATYYIMGARAVLTGISAGFCGLMVFRSANGAAAVWALLVCTAIPVCHMVNCREHEQCAYYPLLDEYLRTAPAEDSNEVYCIPPAI